MKEDLKNKRSAILRATLELIAKQGFRDTSISKIARNAKVNVGSIYYYFTSKEDIINALYIENKTNLIDNSLQSYTATLPIEESFKLLFRNIISYFVKNQTIFSFLEQFESSPHIKSINQEKYRSILKPYEILFERAKQHKMIKNLPVEILQALFTGAILSLTKYYIKSGVDLDESSLPASIDAIWDMVKI